MSSCLQHTENERLVCIWNSSTSAMKVVLFSRKQETMNFCSTFTALLFCVVLLKNGEAQLTSVYKGEDFKNALTSMQPGQVLGLRHSTTVNGKVQVYNNGEVDKPIAVYSLEMPGNGSAHTVTVDDTIHLYGNNWIIENLIFVGTKTILSVHGSVTIRNVTFVESVPNPARNWSINQYQDALLNIIPAAPSRILIEDCKFTISDQTHGMYVSDDVAKDESHIIVRRNTFVMESENRESIGIRSPRLQYSSIVIEENVFLSRPGKSPWRNFVRMNANKVRVKCNWGEKVLENGFQMNRNYWMSASELPSSQFRIEGNHCDLQNPNATCIVVGDPRLARTLFISSDNTFVNGAQLTNHRTITNVKGSSSSTCQNHMIRQTASVGTNNVTPAISLVFSPTNFSMIESLFNASHRRIHAQYFTVKLENVTLDLQDLLRH